MRTEAKAHPAGRDVIRHEQRSFGYAFAGMLYAWRTQRHLRVQVALGGIAIVLGFLTTLTAAEWALLLVTIAFVLALEMLNTVVEAVVDLASPTYHPLARVAKDVSAGAVLVASIGSIGVGAVLFVPRLLPLLTR